MCNRYRAAGEGLIDYAAQFANEDVIDPADEPLLEPFSEIVSPWEGTRMPVVYHIEAGSTLGFMRWGVWPFYERVRPKSFAATCNARDDALLTKAIWKKAAAGRRCLIPADGFYEWAGPKGAKWRVLFHRPDDAPFFFAGVWQPDPIGGSRGFSIVTTKPNALIAALPHDRMPVILGDDEARAWIGREPMPAAELLALCRPFEGELLRADEPRPDPKGKITRTDLDLFSDSSS